MFLGVALQKIFSSLKLKYSQKVLVYKYEPRFTFGNRAFRISLARAAKIRVHVHKPHKYEFTSSNELRKYGFKLTIKKSTY